MRMCPKCHKDDTEDSGKVATCNSCSHTWEIGEVKYCNTNHERVCDDTCIAYNPEGHIIVREPFFDRSRVVPEWIWLSKKTYKAAVCKSGGFAIKLGEEMIPPPLEE